MQLLWKKCDWICIPTVINDHDARHIDDCDFKLTIYNSLPSV